jgi:DNA (cytosine-5)-methyltransferase 1
MSALFNEVDPYAARWLERLSERGHIAQGTVDRRDVRTIDAVDVGSVAQFHAFAGIGVWSYALRLAGWPDDVPVWTGSCHCQPFSQAGKRRGTTDERHLWPTWFRLLEKCRPPVVFGEQVGSEDGLAWLDSVSSDLENAGYAVAAADLCAAGVGAPHMRQRLFFVALANDERRQGIGLQLRQRQRQPRETVPEAPRGGETGELADAESRGRRTRGSSGADGRPSLEPHRHRATRGVGNARRTRSGRNAGAVLGSEGEGEGERRGARSLADEPLASGDARGVMAHTGSDRREGSELALDGQRAPSVARRPPDARDPRHRFWDDADWIACSDGKARPVEPGTFPLAHGATARVGRLRAYGNAIVPEVAAFFVEQVIEILESEAGAP